MDLRDWTIPRAKVPLPGKAQPGGEKPFIEVRGLSADDLTFLIMMHHAEITKSLVVYQEQQAQITKGGAAALTSFLLTILKDFPDLMAEVISAATDALDDETREKAKRLPITTQLLAINEIVKLTLQEVGDLKNLLAEMRAQLASASAGAK